MKLQPDRHDASLNMIAAFGPQGVTINGEIHATSLIVPWSGAVQAWACERIEDFTPEHFAGIARLQPEVVLLGTGPRIRFPSPAALRPLIEQRIGYETMDTAAACRTYNILAGEGRKVVAALLVVAG